MKRLNFPKPKRENQEMTIGRSILEGKVGVITMLVCVSLFVFSTNGMSMPTTYPLTVNGMGTFTLDQPIDMMPTTFLSWDMTIANRSFNSATDSPSSLPTFCDIGFCELNTLNVNSQSLRFIIGFSTSSTGAFSLPNATFVSGFFGPGRPAGTIPEPASLLLFGSGLAGLAVYLWYQRRRERTQLV